jgi:hypothetical protein
VRRFRIEKERFGIGEYSTSYTTSSIFVDLFPNPYPIMDCELDKIAKIRGNPPHLFNSAVHFSTNVRYCAENPPLRVNTPSTIPPPGIYIECHLKYTLLLSYVRIRYRKAIEGNTRQGNPFIRSSFHFGAINSPCPLPTPSAKPSPRILSYAIMRESQLRTV